MGSISTMDDTTPLPRTVSKLEILLAANKKTYLQLVKDFKPKPSKGAIIADFSETDTVVAARVRPLLANEIEDGQLNGIYVRSEGFIDVHELREKPRPPPTLNSFEFQLHKSYGPEQSSEAVYQDLVEPLIPWSWGGGVSTLFAYGQTGSGKTYTVSELQRLAAGDLMNGTIPGKRAIHMCSFELAGNNAFDLLNERQRIKVLEDSFGETQLLGIKEYQLTSPEHLLELVEKSMKFRKSASTFKNDSSSRSHAIWRIRIINRDVPETPDGLLFLIDLAGSEFARDYQTHTDAQKKESRDINMSLSTLKDCIRGRAMMEKHIPFRHSALTKVLKHVFDPKGDRGCKTAVLACVNPSATDVGPGKNTLRFAEMLKVPVPKPTPAAYHPEVPKTWTNAQLHEWITKKSGTPPISATLLAPTESGTQLTRLPKEVFIARCLLTPSVSQDQARAFHAKLWRLQIDARNLELVGERAKSDAARAIAAKAAKAEAIIEKQATPFQQRLEPGMFVRWSNKLQGVPEQFAMVLTPEYAFPGTEGVGIDFHGPHRRMICAKVVEGPLPGSYVLSVTEQKPVPVKDMEGEVLLEYDAASRYYFLNL